MTTWNTGMIVAHTFDGRGDLMRGLFKRFADRLVSDKDADAKDVALAARQSRRHRDASGREQPGAQPERESAQAKESQPAQAAPVRRQKAHTLPVYPPTDEGIELFEVVAIIESQSELVGRIRLAAGLPDDVFDQRFMEPIRRLANAVHLLPASEIGSHCGAGGLFRLALETSFFTFQRSEATIFSSHLDMEERREVEPRWQYASWLAGLCCELYRPIGLMTVTTRDGRQWPPYQQGLAQWVRESGEDRYFVKWSPHGTHQSGMGAAATLAQQIIPAESLQFIHSKSNQIVPSLFDVITHVDSSSILARLVNEIRERVAQRDQASSPRHYGRVTVGQHVEPHLLTVMRSFLESGKWVLNEHKGKIWLSDDGLFLVWKHAAKDILDEVQHSKMHGLPRDPQTLLEILCKAGIVELGVDGSPYWTIYTSANPLLAVRFANEDTLLSVFDHEVDRIPSLFKPPEEDAPIKPKVSETERPRAESSRSIDAPQPAPSTEPAKPAVQKSADRQSAQDPPAPTRVAPQDNVPQVGAAAGGATRKPAGQQRPAAPRGTGEIPKELLDQIEPVYGEMLKALVEDWRKGAIDHLAGSVPEGFAISQDAISRYGVGMLETVGAFREKGWLYSDPNAPAKKLFQVNIQGCDHRAMIVRMAVARDLRII